jgi:hypothetical protein
LAIVVFRTGQVGESVPKLMETCVWSSSGAGWLLAACAAGCWLLVGCEVALPLLVAGGWLLALLLPGCLGLPAACCLLLLHAVQLRPQPVISRPLACSDQRQNKPPCFAFCLWLARLAALLRLTLNPTRVLRRCAAVNFIRVASQYTSSICHEPIYLIELLHGQTDNGSYN